MLNSQSSPASSAVDGEKSRISGSSSWGAEARQHQQVPGDSGAARAPSALPRAALPLGERAAGPGTPKRPPISSRAGFEPGSPAAGPERGYGFSLSQGCRMVRMERTEEARPHSPTKAGLLL